MNTNFVLLILLLASFPLIAQTEKDCQELLTKINTQKDFENQKAIYPDWLLEYVEVNPLEKSRDSLVFTDSISRIIKYGGSIDYYLKLIDKEQKEFCTLQYILLSKPNLATQEINELQNQIINEYNEGNTAEKLLEKYHQLGFPTGKMEWFSKESKAAEFEAAVWNVNANTAEKVSILSKNWYYVIFKTEGNRMVDVAHCVKLGVCEVGCNDLEKELPEVLAEFPGGQEALKQFIRSEVIYPKSALESKTEGQVVVSFVVERDGSLSELKIVKGVSVALNNEALRLIQIMPTWTPATVKGMSVRSGCQLPITFHLDR
jgi:TonB family protein